VPSPPPFATKFLCPDPESSASLGIPSSCVSTVPRRGWSSVDCPGNPTYDPEEDLIFIEELKKLLRPDIEVRSVPANMEEECFAAAVAAACAEVFGLSASEPGMVQWG